MAWNPIRAPVSPTAKRTMHRNGSLSPGSWPPATSRRCGRPTARSTVPPRHGVVADDAPAAIAVAGAVGFTVTVAPVVVVVRATAANREGDPTWKGSAVTTRAGPSAGRAPGAGEGPGRTAPKMSPARAEPAARTARRRRNGAVAGGTPGSTRSCRSAGGCGGRVGGRSAEDPRRAPDERAARSLRATSASVSTGTGTPRDGMRQRGTRRVLAPSASPQPAGRRSTCPAWRVPGSEGAGHADTVSAGEQLNPALGGLRGRHLAGPDGTVEPHEATSALADAARGDDAGGTAGAGRGADGRGRRTRHGNDLGRRDGRRRIVTVARTCPARASPKRCRTSRQRSVRQLCPGDPPHPWAGPARGMSWIKIC